MTPWRRSSIRIPPSSSSATASTGRLSHSKFPKRIHRRRRQTPKAAQAARVMAVRVLVEGAEVQAVVEAEAVVRVAGAVEEAEAAAEAAAVEAGAAEVVDQVVAVAVVEAE